MRSPVPFSSRWLLTCLAVWPAVAWSQASPEPPAPEPAPAPAPSPAPSPAPTPAPAPAGEAAPATAPAPAPKPADTPYQLPSVRIEGRASDDARRQQSTAAKIVIGREEIERYGDNTVGEVLKRLPGVTMGGRPGRRTGPQMRGMGAGFTRLLVNGERMPPGFSLEDIPAEQIERIEVMRAPTAEFGASAIAGTINIVLREMPPRRANDLTLALQSEQGHLSPRLMVGRNDKLGDDGATYQLMAVTGHQIRDDHAQSHTTTLEPATGSRSEQAVESRSRTRSDNVHANGRLQFKWGEDTVSLQPFLQWSQPHQQSALRQVWTPPDAPTAAPYDAADTASQSRTASGRLQAQWNGRRESLGRLEARATLGALRTHSESAREERSSGAFYRSQADDNQTRQRTWSLTGKATRLLENEHSLVGGLEAEGTANHQQRLCSQTYDPAVPRSACAYLAEAGENSDAKTLRQAAYLQDEWAVGTRWAFYAGLRWEGIRTQVRQTGSDTGNKMTVLTPLLHGLYKLDDNSREQVRASLTRSFRPPNASDLSGRLTINSRYPCDDPQRPCGSNEIDAPDSQGNPDLRPELATGVEIGYEKYLQKGGVLSANLFYRRIEGLTRTRVQLETVPYAPVPRWVSRPRNLGTATTSGLELEAKTRLDEYLPDAPAVNLRANLSLFQSRVDSVPGPDNRLDQQPRYVLNLGADYRLSGLPLTVGASLNYTPAVRVQQSEQTRLQADPMRQLDATLRWQPSLTSSVRLALSNLLPRTHSTTRQSITDTRVLTQHTDTPTFSVVRLSWEMKL